MLRNNNLNLLLLFFERFFVLPFGASSLLVALFICCLKLNTNLINNLLLVYVVTGFNLIIFLIHIEPIQRKRTSKELITEFFKPVFFVSTLTTVMMHLNPLPKFNQRVLDDISTTLFVISVVSGSLIVFLKRQRIESAIASNQKNERKSEIIRKNHFENKFQLFSALNMGGDEIKGFLGNKQYTQLLSRISMYILIFVIRLPYIFLKKLYTEGWQYPAMLTLIIASGLYLRIRGLSSLGFWVDEGLSVLVAKRISMGLGQTVLNGSFYSIDIVYHHYLALALLIFKNYPIYLVARLINTPFYIGTTIVLYSFAKKISSKATGIITAVLYCLSWFSIDMFKEARFYEFFIFCFLTFIYIAYILIQDITKLPDIYFLRRNKKKIIALLIFLALSFDASFLTFLSLYAFSLYFLIEFFIEKNINKLIIFVSSITLILIGVMATANNLQEITKIFKFTSPYWLTQSHPILEFYTFFISNSYSAIILIIIYALLPEEIILRKNKKIIFLSSFCLGLYLMVALQGYGNIAVRYYYFSLPFAVLLISVSYYYLSKIIQFKILPIILVAAVLIIIPQAYTESYAANLGVSKIDIKNTNNLEGYAYIKNNFLMLKPTFIVHHQFGTSFYLYFDRTPDYMINPSALDKDPYLNIENINVDMLKNLHNSIIIFYKDTGPLFTKVNNILSDDVVYQQNRLIIYYIH